MKFLLNYYTFFKNLLLYLQSRYNKYTVYTIII